MRIGVPGRNVKTELHRNENKKFRGDELLPTQTKHVLDFLKKYNIALVKIDFSVKDKEFHNNCIPSRPSLSTSVVLNLV